MYNTNDNNLTNLTSNPSSSPRSIGDPYLNNSKIRLITKPDKYELWFTTEFSCISIGQQNAVFTQLLYDLHHADKNKELHIFISSVGGSIDTLTSMLPSIKQFTRVVTIALGEVCSCGFILWACGHERYASPISAMLHHAVNALVGGSPSSLLSYSDLLNDLVDTLLEQTFINDILTPEEIELAKTSDVWILGKDLIARGAAFDVATYKNRICLIPDANGIVKFQDKLYKCDDTNKLIPVIFDTKNALTIQDLVAKVNKANKATVKQIKSKNK